MIIDSLFIVFAIIFSLFYALCYWRIFNYPHTDEVYKKIKSDILNITRRAQIHNFWTYFVCSLTGWACFYILYASLLKQGLDKIDVNSITVNHFLLLLIGLLGVVGFLPLTLWGIANTVQYLAKEVTGRIFK